MRSLLRHALGAALVTAAVVSTSAAAGCARVQPYQREVLSLRAMQGETERVENRFAQHWQESREGSMGGYAAAGGGCGCN